MKIRIPLCWMLMVSCAFAGAQVVDPVEVLEQIDRVRSLATDFSAIVTTTVIRPGSPETITRFRYFRRDMEKAALLVVLGPPELRGRGYLLLAGSGWSYLPENRRTTPAQGTITLGDSDLWLAGFAWQSLVAGYRVTGQRPQRLDGQLLVVLELTPAVRGAEPAMRVWVLADNALPIRIETLDTAGEVSRTIHVREYRRFGETYIATRLLFVDSRRQGYATEVTIDDSSTAPLASQLFTIPFLQLVGG